MRPWEQGSVLGRRHAVHRAVAGNDAAIRVQDGYAVPTAHT
ncbi:unnamed protein product [[Actinomadura] parvosata subsp. kistnae]|nr:hypothetical protein [Nonomuraea sp. ATCC 55076]SPL99817.1 unnamed protein product [Actinomadura parvosata subsp. kistnae]